MPHISLPACHGGTASCQLQFTSRSRRCVQEFGLSDARFLGIGTGQALVPGVHELQCGRAVAQHQNASIVRITACAA